MVVLCANWEFNIGRFDIQFYVSTIGSYNVVLSNGNLGALVRIFGYINHHIKLNIIYDIILIKDRGEFYLELNWLEL